MAGSFQKGEEVVVGSAFPRVRRPLDGSIDRQTDAALERNIFWRGFRELDAGSSESDLRDLAEAIVEVVRERGPFLSMAEFVNRQLGPADEEASRKGALQAAIDRTEINADSSPKDGHPVDPGVASKYGYASPAAVEGHTSTGYPGDVTQGDLLSLIGSRISVRSDTFKIRAYGDAVDASGRIIARAWCEATVQRVPGFVDPADVAWAAEAELSSVNAAFGRRFELTSFRWLSPDEI
jgi:hypothetical protein